MTSTLNRDKQQFSFLPSGKIKIGSLLLSATCSLSLWKQKQRITESQNHRIVGAGRHLCGSS